jgi:hypothetical protein
LSLLQHVAGDIADFVWGQAITVGRHIGLTVSDQINDSSQGIHMIALQGLPLEGFSPPDNITSLRMATGTVDLKHLLPWVQVGRRGWGDRTHQGPEYQDGSENRLG